MFTTTLFGRILSVELISGIGFFLEFSDSRPIWLINGDTTSVQAFEGTTIMLSLLVITFGKVHGNIYYEL